MAGSVPWWAPASLAVQMLTRLPLPWLARLDAATAQAAARRMTAWLPLAGTLVGTVTAGVFVAALRLWPPMIAAGVALGVEAVLTGAFHEDAVADFCDAFGGRATGDEARRIMRDSRIGSYGALGLLLLVGLRWGAMAALPAGGAAAVIVGAATIGRGWAVALLRLAPPRAGDGGLAAVLGAPSRGTLALALLVSLPGIAVVGIGVLAVALIVSAVALGWLASAVRRRIGGSSGDCLGFAAYAGQVVVLLIAAAW